MRHIWLFSRSIDLCVRGISVRTTWAVFIVGIDVSHVWSTLFRAYLDREEFGSH